MSNMGLGNMISFAMQAIQKNNNIPNTPLNQNMINAIQNGDTAKGEELANNIIQSMGLSRDEALNQARQFFGM